MLMRSRSWFSISVQSSWAHFYNYCHCCTHNVPYGFQTIGQGNKKDQYESDPTPVKPVQHTYFSNGALIVSSSLVALLRHLALPCVFNSALPLNSQLRVPFPIVNTKLICC